MIRFRKLSENHPPVGMPSVPQMGVETFRISVLSEPTVLAHSSGLFGRPLLCC